MKRSKYTEEQILFAVKQTEAEQPVADVCRQLGIAEATFYVWKKKYDSLGATELRDLRQLREENSKLKRLVARAHERWSPILEVARGMSGSAVATALDRAIARHGKP